MADYVGGKLISNVSKGSGEIPFDGMKLVPSSDENSIAIFDDKGQVIGSVIKITREDDSARYHIEIPATSDESVSFRVLTDGDSEWFEKIVEYRINNIIGGSF